MIGKHFIHAFLLLAMLFSQMATNAHMIDHMAVAAIDCDLSISHPDDHHHHHDDVKLKAPSDDTSNSDCSIYHAYAGSNGLAPTDCKNNDIYTKSIVFKQSLCTQLIAQTITTHPIRGPPLHS